MTKYLGIVGYPVSHTLSPIMHNAALQKQKLPYLYLPYEVKPADLKSALCGLKAINCVGLNVTIPHKVAVMAYLAEVSQEANLIGAVNTLVLKDGGWVGYNTDGKGFLCSLTIGGTNPEGKGILIFGAGGAARAVAVQLGLAGVRRIVFANRTEEKAFDLAEELARKLPQVSYHFVGYRPEELKTEVESAEIIINATPVGMESMTEKVLPVEEDWFKTHHLVADLVYRPLNTPFLQKAQSAGARVLTGEGMLLYQGVEAYRLWTGIEPPVQVMCEALMSALLSESMKKNQGLEV